MVQSSEVNGKYRYKISNNKCSKEPLPTSYIGEYWKSFMLTFQKSQNEENKPKMEEFSVLQVISIKVFSSNKKYSAINYLKVICDFRIKLVFWLNIF